MPPASTTPFPAAPSRFDADRKAGHDARRLGRRTEALEHFRAASMARPHDPWNRNDIALELLALGRAAEAFAEAEALAASAPDFAPARRTLGLAARKTGDIDAALLHFQDAANLDPRDLWNRHDAAACLRSLGKRDAAAEAFVAVAADTPLAHSLRALGELERDVGRHAEALAYFQISTRLLPGDAWFQLDLATALERVGRLGEAEAILAELCERQPTFLPAYRRAADSAARRGDGQGACVLWEAAIRHAPRDATLRNALADMLLRLDRRDEAETRYLEALMLLPGNSGALIGLARTARLNGRSDIAAAHLKALEAAASPDAFERMAIAGEWLAIGEAGRARRAVSEIGGDPATSEAALVDLASLVRRLDGPAAARRIAERLVRNNPAHPRALILLADDARDRGLLAEADALYDRALDAKPDLYWAFIGKAAVARGLGRCEDAARHLDSAEAIDPVEGFARLERAADLRNAGRIEEAAEVLAGLPAGSARQKQAATALAQIARARGDWLEASRLFEAVALRWPGDVDPLVEAAEDAFRGGAEVHADDLLTRAARLDPDRSSRLEAEARRALIRDDPEHALSLYRRIEAQEPGRLFPALAAARIEMTLGRTESGLAAFQRAIERFGERPEIALATIEMQRQRGCRDAADALLAEARRRFPHHFGLALAEIQALTDAGAYEAACRSLDDLTASTPAEDGRLALARCLWHAAQFDFTAAVREGERAAERMPGDGWVLNRLIHAALLDLDLDRAGRRLADLSKLEASANRLRGKSTHPSQSHYGQLYDEFRMDDLVLSRLQHTQALGDEDALDAVADIVRAHPDNTAAAIRFFILQRRTGKLDVGPTAQSSIPPSIHQYWDDPQPPGDLEPLIESWRAAHPNFSHRLYDDAAARAFLGSSSDPRGLAAYERAQEPAMKADLFRLALLAERGGLYVDADDRCLKSLSPAMSSGCGLLLYQEDLGSLGNNLIAARPRHPVIERARDLAVEAVLRGDSDILWLSTGPGLLTRAAATCLAEAPSLLDDMLILDRPALLDMVAIHCLAAYKTTERHWSRTAFGRGRSRASKA
ncbi:hypothetical protein ASG43_08625 [Aureimonas sp. Leaf454]|uniref:tetratricopeptide repeat protein n=1 Tax=Aureimonas sp. Leaf454 TaxID=1736381 RepID=UPI0006FA5173|nr:tetratricopeptide repeat protein [Aureimonas sp. Leaf454]KQT48895.1 hypothetical protein ASG43_08625 [Aureimonas sp. Leaf454]